MSRIKMTREEQIIMAKARRINVNDRSLSNRLLERQAQYIVNKYMAIEANANNRRRRR